MLRFRCIKASSTQIGEWFHVRMLQRFHYGDASIDLRGTAMRGLC